MKLPKYTRQVGTSSETGAVRGDVGSAGQEWRAIGQIAGQVTGLATDVMKTRNALEARREEAQRTRLRDKAEGEIGVLMTQYRDSASTRKDFDKMGAKDDPEGYNLQEQVNKILSSDEYTSRPDLRDELLMDAGFGIEKAKSNIAKIGTERLQDATNATNETLAQTRIGLGDEAGMVEVYERTRGKTRTDAEVDEAIAKGKVAIDNTKSDRAILANPVQAKEDLKNQLEGKSSTYPNLSRKKLKAQINYADATYNEQTLATSTDMWDRFNAIKQGRGKGDSFDALSKDLETADIGDKIKPKDYASLRESIDNPYGEVKSLPADELQRIYSEVAAYDPDTDPKFSRRSELWSKINQLPDRDRGVVAGIMKGVEKGEPVSPYYDDLNRMVAIDTRPDIFGEQKVSTELGTKAQREYSKYLQANPTDFDGAQKLYKEIIAVDIEKYNANYFRKKYSYGQDGGKVVMIDPKGNTLMVPAGKVEELIKLGAKRK